MYQKDIHEGHFYIGRSGSGWTREVLGVFIGWQGRNRVAWRDHIGRGECDKTAFAQWAEAECATPLKALAPVSTEERALIGRSLPELRQHLSELSPLWAALFDGKF